MKRGLALLLLAVLTVFLWWHWRPPGPRTPQRRLVQTELSSRPSFVPEKHANQSTGAPDSGKVLPSATADPAVTSASAAPAAQASVPPLPPELAQLAPATILENMRTAIRNYASALGENPVGTNAEITKSLQGDNPKHIVFLKEDGNRVNANGELVDAWGTPYFFHQLSGHEMEIRSAGPDRRMWTADDLVTR